MSSPTSLKIDYTVYLHWLMLLFIFLLLFSFFCFHFISFTFHVSLTLSYVYLHNSCTFAFLLKAIVCCKYFSHPPFVFTIYERVITCPHVLSFLSTLTYRLRVQKIRSELANVCQLSLRSVSTESRISTQRRKKKKKKRKLYTKKTIISPLNSAQVKNNYYSNKKDPILAILPNSNFGHSSRTPPTTITKHIKSKNKQYDHLP